MKKSWHPHVIAHVSKTSLHKAAKKAIELELRNKIPLQRVSQCTKTFQDLLFGCSQLLFDRSVKMGI